jgi:exodeoxyribonuclease VII large subunit
MKLQQYIDQLHVSTKQKIKEIFSNKEHQLNSYSEKSYSFDPKRVLERGFSMTLDYQGKLIRSAKNLKEKQDITTRFVDGEVKSTIL